MAEASGALDDDDDKPAGALGSLIEAVRLLTETLGQRSSGRR